MEKDEHKRNSNLARIRDNQRRSRARRREYLQELETKYRACEQTGIEASAEIQAAARKVVDENRRLRQLLKQQGLSDREINSISADSEGSTANELEALIGVRRRCAPGTGCGDGGGSGSRTQSCSSVSPTVSAQQSDSERQAQQMQAYATATSSRGGGTTTTLRTSTTATPSSMHPYSPYPSSLPMPAVSTDYTVPFDENFPWHDDLAASHDFLASTSLPETGGTTSCSVAASAIRSVQPGLGRELEAELGCEDCGGEQECSVQNIHIFQVMDRYSSVS